MALPILAGDDLTAAHLMELLYALLTTYGSHAQVLTDQTTTSASYTDLATAGPAVTLTSVGTQALVLFGTMQYVSSEASFGSAMSVAVSGATTTAASDNYKLAATEGAIGEGAAACQFAILTITPGSNTYTCKYRVGSNTITGHFINRHIWVLAP